MEKKEKKLHLTLIKKWYDLIESGEKKEEYREIKEYWINRLTTFNESENLDYEFKKFSSVIFKNGYQKNAPMMEFEILEITEGIPKLEWSDNTHETYFIIKLGKRIN